MFRRGISPDKEEREECGEGTVRNCRQKIENKENVEPSGQPLLGKDLLRVEEAFPNLLPLPLVAVTTTRGVRHNTRLSNLFFIVLQPPDLFRRSQKDEVENTAKNGQRAKEEVDDLPRGHTAGILHM